MSISSSFSNALSGLNVTRRLADLTSGNLANALTDGYARQTADVGSAVLQGRGSGAYIRGINRASAPDLTASRRLADGDAATFGPNAQALARLGQALGEATSEEGLFRRIETFEAAMRFLAETPESEPRQVQAADAARDVALYLNQLSDETATVRQNADGAIGDQVRTVNTNLRRIDELDAKITRLTATNRDTAALVDERERLIDEVNAIIPLRVHGQDDGTVHLTTQQGLYLLASKPATIEFSRSPIITAPMVYDPLGGGALSGLVIDGIDVTPGGSNPQKITTGSLAGHFAVRDEIGTTFNQRIDQFAADLIQRFEDPAVDPTLAPGDPGLFTDNGAVYDPLIIDGLAGRIDLNVAVDLTQGGDASRLRDGLQSVGPGAVASDTIVRGMLDALTAPRSAASIPGVDGSLSAAGMVAGIVEITGVLRTDAESEFASQTATREALAGSEAREIGVDVDFELQNLIQIEQAYAANLQVIQAASRMLQQISEIR